MEKEMYAMFCASCGEEIKSGNTVMISESGNCYDTMACLDSIEPGTVIEYWIKE
jgi:hypothetical protein